MLLQFLKLSGCILYIMHLIDTHTHTHTHTHTLRSSWCTFSGVSLVAQTVKNPPAMQAIRDQSLGQEDPLEKEMATHSKILAWKIPWTFLSSWTEEPSGLQSMGSPRVRHNWTTNTSSYFFFFSCTFSTHCCLKRISKDEEKIWNHG